MINFSQDTMHQLVQIHVERINALELALKTAQSRIEELEWEAHIARIKEGTAVAEAEIRTINWINQKLNPNFNG
jgi:hypothetical protein